MRGIRQSGSLIALLVAAGCGGPPAAAPANGPPAPAQKAAVSTAPSFPTTHESADKTERPAPPGLVAMREELARAMQTLGKAKPNVHHLAYTVTAHEQVSLDGEYGTIASDSKHENRSLDVDLRVGTPQFDSSHPSRSVAPAHGHHQTLPLGDDAIALKQVAWIATDGAYKDAAERFVSLQNQKDVKAEDEDKSPDFSQEPPQKWIGAPPPPLGLDLEQWRGRLRTLSAMFKGDKEIHDAHVSLVAGRRTRWYLDSAGSELAFGERSYRVMITARTQADDGMPLGLFKSFEAWSPESLPTDAQMSAAIKEMQQTLHGLRRAPLAEPFAGPAILEGRAAGVFFHEVIGHRLEAHRLRNDFDGQTFGKKLNEPVMPSFLTLYDDPTIKKLGDVELNGHFFYDDEGVAAQRATLVDKGVLKGFLFGRTPARGLVASNGHGRRQEGMPLVARQGNLVLEASETVPKATLRQRLVEEAKKQGRAYGLRFVDIQGGFTDTSRFGTQGFKVMPTVVYRVYVDGRPDELIRGVDIVGTPLAMLMRIQAAGDDHDVFNGVCGAESGWVPVSATAPSLLVGQIETALKDKGNTKPPVLESPAFQNDEEVQ
ncbi:MAG TPA: metallopeptidase TldD-related protein [Labilithrix sp.]